MTLFIAGKAVSKTTGKMLEWSIDLAALEVGGVDFRGRPALTARILPGLQSLYERTARSTAYRGRSNVHYFWRFLDEYEKLAAHLPGVDPVAIDDLDWNELERIWRHFIDWLRRTPESVLGARSKYYINSTVHAAFQRAFELADLMSRQGKNHLETYVYFSEKRSIAYGGNPLDFDEAKMAFGILANVWRRTLKRIAAAHVAAETGINPMTGSNGSSRWSGSTWDSFANRMWAVKNHLPIGGLSRHPELLRRFRDGLARDIPQDFQIQELRQGTSGMAAHSALLFLRAEEIAVALAMVTMKTGMNLDAITRMPVANWYKPDGIQPDKRVIIFGPKRIGNTKLRASSSRTKATDPFRIMQKVIEIQAPLRARMIEISKETGDVELAETAELIWIYPSGGQEIVHLQPRGTTFEQLNRALNSVFDAANATRKDGSPLRYKFSDGRDIWGLFVYERSGFNHLLTAQALGHSTLTSLLHYLEKKTLVAEDAKRLIDLQDRVLLDLSNGKYSPKSYRPAVGDQAITGLHCSDPLNPAPEADPGNGGGRTCATQACWTCWNWYASKDSLVPLSRIIQDLEVLESEMALALWQTSDFPTMLAVYRHIVQKFHPSHIVEAQRLALEMKPIIQTSMFVNVGARE